MSKIGYEFFRDLRVPNPYALLNHAQSNTYKSFTQPCSFAVFFLWDVECNNDQFSTSFLNIMERRWFIFLSFDEYFLIFRTFFSDGEKSIVFDDQFFDDPIIF